MNTDVVILFGGTSSERLVSVASAQHVSAHLPHTACWFISPHGQVFEIATDELSAHQRPFESELTPKRPPLFLSLAEALDSSLAQGWVFFLALHGGDGENGVIQRLLEARGLAFTGSGSEASALGFDKVRTRELALAAGARLADAVTLPPQAPHAISRSLQQLLQQHPRWVLKPQADGSSHGLIHLRAPSEIDAVAEALARLQVPYLAEIFIEGRELTVGVVDFETGLEALAVSEVRLVPGASFDYEGKYLGRGTEEITPALLTDTERVQAQQLALLTHRVVQCFGYSRTDMILAAEGLYLLEINTLPGLTNASFIPQQLAASGHAMRHFLERQLQLARARRDRRL